MLVLRSFKQCIHFIGTPCIYTSVYILNRCTACRYEVCPFISSIAAPFLVLSILMILLGTQTKRCFKDKNILIKAMPKVILNDSMRCFCDVATLTFYKPMRKI